MSQENERLGIVIDDVKRSTVDYKNQLSSARREVTEVTGKFEQSRAKLEDSETEVRKLTSELGKLESEVTVLREDKLSKEREITKVTQKVSMIIGSSEPELNFKGI